MLYWLIGDLAKASVDYQKAAELQPDNNIYHHKLAGVLIERGQRSAAEALYRRAYQSNSRRDWALQGWLGMLLQDERRYDELLAVTRRLRGKVLSHW